MQCADGIFRLIFARIGIINNIMNVFEFAHSNIFASAKLHSVFSISFFAQRNDFCQEANETEWYILNSIWNVAAYVPQSVV